MGFFFCGNVVTLAPYFADIKPKLSETATPPPSPTHPTSLHNFPHQLSAASFKTDVKSLKKELLLTIQHLFTWAPIGQIPADLIPCVFRFTNVYSYAQVRKRRPLPPRKKQKPTKHFIGRWRYVHISNVHFKRNTIQTVYTTRNRRLLRATVPTHSTTITRHSLSNGR